MESLTDRALAAIKKASSDFGADDPESEQYVAFAHIYLSEAAKRFITIDDSSVSLGLRQADDPNPNAPLGPVERAAEALFKEYLYFWRGVAMGEYVDEDEHSAAFMRRATKPDLTVLPGGKE